MHRTLRALALAAVLIAAATTCTAAEYSDPSGFTFTYPQGWSAVPKPGNLVNDRDLPPAIHNFLRKNGASLNMVNVLLIRNGQEEFLENMNVVVESSEQIPLNDTSVRKIKSVLTEQLRSSGIFIQNVDARLQKLGANDAIVVEYSAQMPGIPFEIKQKQAYFAGGGKTFIVTCTAPTTTYLRHVGTFDNVLSSFTVPKSGGGLFSNSPFGGSNSKTMWIVVIGLAVLFVMAIVVVAAAIILWMVFSGKKRRRTVYD